MDDEFVSYRSPRTIVAETVYHFFRGGMYGFAYGLVSYDNYDILSWKKMSIEMFAIISVVHLIYSQEIGAAALKTSSHLSPLKSPQVTPFHAPGSPGALNGK